MAKQIKKQPKKVAMPVIAKGSEPAVFEKLVRAAKDYDQAWQFIHKTFPRAKYGKVRDVVQKFSKHKTLRAAFNAMQGKKVKGEAKSAAKMSIRKAA